MFFLSDRLGPWLNIRRGFFLHHPKAFHLPFIGLSSTKVFSNFFGS